MGKLDTDYGTIGELLKTPKVFEVPKYQRAYSWSTKIQVQELWSDIVRLYRSAAESGEAEDHFIGHVVTGASSPVALGAPTGPIIDGQQRLITLSLLVAAIRDALVADDETQAQITSQYLAFVEGAKIVSLRVTPGESDRKSYEAIVKGIEGVDKKGKVAQTYRFFVDRLKALPYFDEELPTTDSGTSDADEELDNVPEAPEEADTQDDASDLGEEQLTEWDWEKLLSVVSTNLFVVSISGVPPENAYQIFASLNHAGMKLAQVDLIRNAVFMLLKDRGEVAYNEIWKPLEDAMGNALLETYLHSWVVRQGSNVPKKDTYRQFMRELSRPGVDELRVEVILKALFVEAWAYLLIVFPDDSAIRKPFLQKNAPKKIVKALNRLREWGSVPMEPLLLETIARWQAGNLTDQAVVNIAQALESFVVRRYIAQVPPNDLRSVFARIVIQVNGATPADFEAEVMQELLDPGRRWPSDGEILDSCSDRPLYRPNSQKFVFFILKRLSEQIDGKEYPHIVLGNGSDEYSIEHVLPQGDGVLTDAWRDDMIFWGDSNPEETFRKRVHTIGNLTLTAYNGELSNSQFAEKRKLINSKLKLGISTMILAQKSEWGATQITARSAELAALAQKIWKRQ